MGILDRKVALHNMAQRRGMKRRPAVCQLNSSYAKPRNRK